MAQDFIYLKDFIGSVRKIVILLAMLVVFLPSITHSLFFTVTPPGWFDTSWKNRTAVTITSNEGIVLSQLPDYHVRIMLSSPNFDFSKAKPDGSDLRFADDSGRLLNHWVEKFDSAGRSAVVWVKVPGLQSNASRSIYAYYGNSNAQSASSYDQTMQKLQAGQSVIGLWHFDEGSGTSTSDSSSNGLAAILNGASWTSSDGGNFGNSSPVKSFSSGSAVGFNGTGGHVAIDNALDSVPADGTIELWFMPGEDISSGAGQRLFSKINDESLSSLDLIDLYFDGGYLVARKASNTNLSTGALPVIIKSSQRTWRAGTWYHVAVMWGRYGFKLYVNGALEGVDFGKATVGAAPFGNGSARDFIVGAYNWQGQVTNGFKGSIDELRILGRALPEDEVVSDFERRATLGPKKEQEKWVKYAGNPVLSPAQSWEGSAVFEPTVMYEGGIFKMWHSAWANGGTCTTGYATSPDGIHWTEYPGNPVLGNGKGGVATACRNSVTKHNDTYYLFFVQTNSSDGKDGSRYVATSTDGINFTVRAQPVLPVDTTPGSWDRQMGSNTDVWVEDNKWFMLYDSGGDDGRWRMGLATGDGPFNWTKYANNPLAELQYGTGTYGAPTHAKIGGNYYLWYLAAEEHSLPSYVYRAFSADLKSWTKYEQRFDRPILPITQASFEFDQTADPYIIQVGDTIYLFYDGDCNSDPVCASTQNPAVYQAWIGVATFNGSWNSLLTDASIDYLLGASDTLAAQPPPQNSPPSVSLTKPVAGSSFTASAAIQFEASASDSDGTVSKVEFYNGLQLLGSDTSAPYAFSWSNVAAGNYILSAKAIDDKGGVAVSNNSQITVNTPVNSPPSISISSPANNSSYTAPASIKISATASDSDGTVSKVEFYKGATKLGESTSAPFSYAWNGVQAGTYVLTAKAYDNSGAEATSGAVNVNVSQMNNSPPTVTISVSQANPVAPANVTLTAVAADTDGTVSKVEFYSGQNKLAEDTAAPYAYQWSNIPAGSYSVTAKAYDSQNASATSSPIVLSVSSPPTANLSVQITSPATESSFPAPATITVTASVQNPDGNVLKVEFFAGETKIGEDATASDGWAFSWVNVPSGSYVITAKASDNSGGSSVSSQIKIYVSEISSPSPQPLPPVPPLGDLVSIAAIVLIAGAIAILGYSILTAKKPPEEKQATDDVSEEKEKILEELKKKLEEL